MALTNLQRTADRDRRFDDVAVPVTFRKVTQSLDKETQIISETHVNTTINAILGVEIGKRGKSNLEQHVEILCHFQVKSEDVSSDDLSIPNRIVHNSTEYDIVAFQLSADGLTYVIESRKRG